MNTDPTQASKPRCALSANAHHGRGGKRKRERGLIDVAFITLKNNLVALLETLYNHYPEKVGDLPLQVMPLRRGLMHIDYADTHVVMCLGL